MSKRRFEYSEPQALERSTVEAILNQDKPSDIRRVLVSVALKERDLDWAYGIVTSAASASDAGVRATAVLCLGHLARIHRRLPDRKAIALVRAALSDGDEYVRGQAENAADDIEMYIPTTRGEIRSQ
jgi:hypothetical protein